MVKDFDIRKYNIRLTKSGLTAPSTQRAKRARTTIKKFVEKNTRAEKGKVLLGEELNNKLWERGIKNPPRKVSVFVQNLKDGRVFVNLEGAPVKVEKKKEDKKKEEKIKKDEGLEKLTEDFKTDKEKKETKEEKEAPKK